MNLVTGNIVDIYVEDCTTMAKVQIGGAFTRVPITFLPEVRLGDIVVIESGVAISKIEPERTEKI